ncbi:MAG: N-acetylmuramic acid 6-phosphate etherase [bacterium]
MLRRTEQRNPLSVGLDKKSAREILELIYEEDQTAGMALQHALPEITRAAKRFAEVFQSGGRIFTVGAGTSGRLGVADCAELIPTFSVDPGRVIGIIAGGYGALHAPAEGAEDDVSAVLGQVQFHRIEPKDLVIGISAGGRTPFVVAFLREARVQNISTVGIFNVSPCPLMDYSEIAVFLDTGPEILTGSTRMKAGTAQKRVLHMISTAAMVQCGKTYDNLMVDLRPGSYKLKERALAILMEFSDKPENELLSLLDSVNYDVKVAILIVRLNINSEEARWRLDRAGGVLRKALEK